MTILLVMGGILILLAIVIVGQAMSASEPRGLNRSLAVLEAMTNAPSELTKDLDKSFQERVLAPARAASLRLGRRFIGADAGERYRVKLDVAGNPGGWTVDRVIASKVMGLIAGGVIGLVLAVVLTGSVLWFVVVFGGIALAGYMAPNMYLYQKSYDRSSRLQRDLPDAIDLMTISVESGLGFDAAIQQVAKNTEGPLADEFTRMLGEMQIGASRSESLRAMAERTNVGDVKTFVSAMVQADAFGIPIAQVLRVQSSEIRTKRRQRAEEKAQQVPVKITIPLIFCILPCLFLAVMGPAVISIMANFSGK
ncbi:type II secretion system F family protein [Nocardioides taihuensis]|uniref:Type II secretion system F family protein n=1 Tax=Nocardioides taihuensis TaxID=1835606 RepID=A0ABW0BNM3_9ACTN